MKYVSFAKERPCIIGGKEVFHRYPRKYTEWIATIFFYLFTKKAK